MSPLPGFRPEERPLFAGSPYSPPHTGERRLAYVAFALFLGTTSTFCNALTTVNTAAIAGPLDIYAAQSAALPAIYVAMNASANLTLVRARAQFGIPEVTSVLLVLNALVGLFQFIDDSFASTIALRAVNGMCAAGLITLGIYYMMQAFPPKTKPIGGVIGIGLPQIGTPLARLVPVDVLTQNGLWGLHAIEVAHALLTLAILILLPLPPSEKSRAFKPLDLVTVVLATSGLVLLCQVIGQGRTLWWTDTPWLGVALAMSIPLLAAAYLIENGRSDPLVHFEWIGSWGILRFAAVALFMRLALAEQTYSAVGLLTLSGLDNDQLRGLFLVVSCAMLLGIGVAALTLSESHLPWQVLVAALIVATGAWIDSDANALTRPVELMLSQAMIGFGTTLFVGPVLLYGFLQVLKRGVDHMVSFVVTFSITQNIGALAGSALLGTFQTIWARNAASVLAANTQAAGPETAARIAGGASALAEVLIDPAQRTGQGASLLGQTLAREAAVIAFTDTFRLVALLGLATAVFILVNVLMAHKLRESGRVANR